MSKNKTDEVVAATVAETTEQQPSPYDDLLKNGTVVLEAPTREDLSELVDKIPDKCRYSVGAVGYNPQRGMFMIQVDIIK